MQEVERTKLSPSLITIKLLLIIGIIFLAITISRDLDKISFKTGLEYQIFLIFLIVILVLVFIFPIPDIYYDPDNLYIKRLGKNEIVIPLKDVVSVCRPFLTSASVFNIYKIEYNYEGELRSVTFSQNFLTDAIPKFLETVKKVNQHLKTI